MSRVVNVAVFSVLLLLSGCLGIHTSRRSGSTSSQFADVECQCPVKNGTVAVIHFRSGDFTVQPAARQLIYENIAECIALRISENPNLKVLITGHTDKLDTLDNSLRLGKERAIAVLEYLLGAVFENLNDPAQEFGGFPISSEKVGNSGGISDPDSAAQTTPFSKDALRNHFCTASAGKNELVDEGDTEEAHARSRRVVIEFVQECEQA
ncbi:putative peptidoglycan-associated lipoprotein (PAL/OmpA) [Neorickettsia risticii str. Illinois]|uniref:Peptidoglycan-associated lipoprotein (PAL/OmpA) n=1 Tax=Neorickettsia risticii (strain Illinois) TaxID=434131 RepID=C6V605_NEORI|nr:OmpA family protein [Neorickettsia risticii]ACT69829.1 putative peptidoglycan-associated lipoprotein (PAL/OmpA) [Neorickettsia risticii str. Illinois]